MTDTPPSQHFVPYVPGQLGQAVDHGGQPDEPQTGSQPPAGLAPPRRSRTPLLVGGLVAVVVALSVAVVVLATRGSGGTPKAATPSWSSVFTAPAPAATYSPPPPREVSVPFGETLTLSGGGDEVLYTVVADKTYTKTKYGTKPKNGIFYGVRITVEVVSGSAYACACDFAFVAADGTVYEGSGHTVDGGLDGVDLNRKQKATGVVVFDIPPSATKGARIELREGTNNQGFWEVP